ncbi:hypothetical protein SUDANB70_01879 [Streptomyces sp. enrichment culture]
MGAVLRLCRRGKPGGGTCTGSGCLGACGEGCPAATRGAGGGPARGRSRAGGRRPEAMGRGVRSCAPGFGPGFRPCASGLRGSGAHGSGGEWTPPVAEGGRRGPKVGRTPQHRPECPHMRHTRPGPHARPGCPADADGLLGGCPTALLYPVRYRTLPMRHRHSDHTCRSAHLPGTPAATSPSTASAGDGTGTGRPRHACRPNAPRPGCPDVRGPGCPGARMSGGPDVRTPQPSGARTPARLRPGPAVPPRSPRRPGR